MSTMPALTTEPLIDPSVFHGLLSGSVVAQVLIIGLMFRQPNLVQRLQILSRSTIVAIVSAVLMVLAYTDVAAIPRPPVDLWDGEKLDVHWFARVDAAQDANRMIVMAGVGVLALLGVQVLAVLASLRSFVVTQEIDLVARDQVALHKATGEDVEGIPVSGIGAPR